MPIIRLAHFIDEDILTVISFFLHLPVHRQLSMKDIKQRIEK